MTGLADIKTDTSQHNSVMEYLTPRLKGYKMASLSLAATKVELNFRQA